MNDGRLVVTAESAFDALPLPVNELVDIFARWLLVAGLGRVAEGRNEAAVVVVHGGCLNCHLPNWDKNVFPDLSPDITNLV